MSRLINLDSVQTKARALYQLTKIEQGNEATYLVVLVILISYILYKAFWFGDNLQH